MTENTLSPHAFGERLNAITERYNTAAADMSAAEANNDRTARKRASDRRRLALRDLATLATRARAMLGDDGAALSGGYRRALETARAALPAAARASLDALPVEDRRTWDPHAVAVCPHCEHVGEVAEDFGARLDILAIPTGEVRKLRAAWVEDDTLAPRQRDRIEGFRPYPHPTKEGHSYMLGPYRQSNCKACRNAAARAAKGV